MNIDIDGLIELAKKATQGKWERGSGSDVLTSECGDEAYWEWEEAGPAQLHESNAENDAEYIAAASPDTIIALCERLREAEKTIQNALSELSAGDVQSAIDQLEARNE